MKLLLLSISALRTPFSYFNPSLRGLSLVVLCALGIAVTGHILVTGKAVKNLVVELDQHTNLNYAETVVPIARQHITETDVDCEELRPKLEQLERESSAVHLYIVDRYWMIRCSTEDRTTQRRYDSTHLTPVRRLLHRNEDAVPILLEDPRQPKTFKPFSAARFQIVERSWYVVAILNGQDVINYHYGFTEATPLNRYNQAALALLSLCCAFVIVRRYVTRGPRLKDYRERKGVELQDQHYRMAKEELSQLCQEVTSMTHSLLAQVSEFGDKQEEKRTFLASLSHDLRSPLAAIRGYIDQLLKNSKHLTEDQARDHLNIIARNTDHVVSLISQIFDLEKFEDLKSSMTFSEFCLSECLKQVYLTFLPIALNKGVTLEYHGPEVEMMIEGDSSLITRACSNLLHNALKFTPEGGTITLSLKSTPTSALIRIKDTGSGIPNEDLPRIFDRFFRGTKSKKEKNGSAGLGLFVVKKVVEAHSGTIRVESEIEIGTTFELELTV